MKQSILIAFLSLIALQAEAQVDYLPDGSVPFNDSTKFFFQLQGERSDYSNALNREFIQTILFGGYIDNDLKERAGEHLTSSNNYAGLLNTSAYITLFKDSSDFGLSLGYEYVNLISIQFSEDLYDLALYGNSHFGENEIDLNQSKESYIHYQKFALGMVHKPTGAYISLGLYDGFDFINYDFGNSKMTTQYTNQNGVSYASNMLLTTDNFESRQSTRGDRLFESGYGFGVSGGYQYKLKKGVLNFTVKDLGAMRWNNLELRDTSGTISHDGFYWDFGSDSDEADIFDSMKDSLVPNATTADKWVMLPGKVELSYFTQTKNKVSLGAKASYQWGLDLYPELQAMGFYHINNQNSVWVNGSFGGFYGASVGLGASVTLCKSSTLNIGSKYITGLISPSGKATNIFLQYNLKL